MKRMHKTMQGRKYSRAAFPWGVGFSLWCALGAAFFLASPVAFAQPQPSVMVPHRTRLFLKDHSYQIVMSYRIQGDRVLFISAERDGVEEEIPLSLIDFDATHRWEQAHPPAGDGSTVAQTPDSPPPVIDPELLKEELERRALTPEVAPDLSLPEQDSVLALDTFQGTPELVPLMQSAGDLNQTTGHSIVRSVVNPMASAHQIVQLRGERASVQLHVNQPVFYLRIGDDTASSTGGTPLVVDTHGASAAQAEVAGNTADSQYVIVRTDVRLNARVISSFNPSRLSEGQSQEDVFETKAEVLPGGHWMKITPRTTLTFGEYALMEITSPREINLGVWDFGVHPASPENRDVLKPEPKRPMTLERRTPD
jgi:hypothetical protein